MIELAKMYGATNRQPVITILKQNNVKTIDRRSIQGKDLTRVENMVKDGLSKRQIAHKLNVSGKAITTAIDRLDIEYEPQTRMYYFDEHIFDVIDTERKAYWIGFLYADAHSNRTSTRIGLAKKDENHLIKLREFVNGDMPIKDTPGNSKSLELNSSYMVRRLHNLGLMPYRQHFSRLHKELPKHLERHFLRGYVDGDGCISNDQRIIILARKDLITWIVDTLYNEVGANKNKIRNRGKILEVGWGGRYIFNSITKYLYKDASVFLDRKMQRIKKQVNW